MAQISEKTNKGRASQVGAATLGTILVYVGKLESAGAVFGQIVVYSAPFLTVVAAGVFLYFEESIISFLAGRKAKKELEHYLNVCDAHLKNEDLDADIRNEIKSKRNLAQLAAINDGYHQVLKNFPDATHSVAVKKSNKKSLVGDSNPSRSQNEQ